ncbi:PD-(D/E)XK nuclease family protein [Geoalkalibacter halelectricus]|uniref:PD-(D/E)XK nuclease family protein n=1 Tax=Geoalkalibacter halelectricus TaxID=2847045 RepID=UPI003D1C1C97
MPMHHFILAEDRAQSRYLKRALAERGAALNLIVGTWPELLEQLRNAFLLPPCADTWSKALESAAQGLEDAFWRESLSVAPRETLTCLDRELRRLLRANGLSGSIFASAEHHLDDRAERHLHDLHRLHLAMGEMLYGELALIRDLLGASGDEALRKIVVYSQALKTPPDPWRRALLERLQDCWGSHARTDLVDVLGKILHDGAADQPLTALRHLGRSLFAGDGARVPLDDSLQWLAVRDPLQEVEVAAGIIQKALRKDATLGFADFALLLPSGGDYARHLQTVFAHCGIPLSGLVRPQPLRNLGGELVSDFLLSMRKPAPVMALASFLSSPLLPWGQALGHDMAQQVMNGNFSLPAPEGLAGWGKRLLSHLREGAVGADQVRLGLGVLAKSLDGGGKMDPHQAHALERIDGLLALLDAGGEFSWEDLLQAAAPQGMSQVAETALIREGVAVFNEGEEPWRKVRRLLVLGFREGQYPAAPQVSPVFSETDLHALRAQSAKPIETAAEIIARRRERLRRQLHSARDKVCFLIPRRDALGAAVQPCQSLTFMAQLFQGADEAEALICELETDSGRDRARGVPFALPKPPVPPRVVSPADLSFQADLLQAFTKADGSLYPLSPSALETLMVSPLAWLLSRMGLEPRDWAPEVLDVATKGTLAHQVFEELFKPGEPIPAADRIRSQISDLLFQAFRKIAPFLLAAEWRVERAHLQKEIEAAALSWAEFLNKTGARVLANEARLSGRFDGLPLKGSADSIVALPEGRLFVIDFKKSKSPARRKRMEKGFDSQASLYRLMLQTGDAVGREDELGCALRRGAEIGVLYYLMNDQTVLCDTSGWIAADLPGAYELGEAISGNAMALIRERLLQLKRGEILLNRQGDEAWFEKNAGITLYALDRSPLLRLFMLPGEVLP